MLDSLLLNHHGKNPSPPRDARAKVRTYSAQLGKAGSTTLALEDNVPEPTAEADSPHAYFCVPIFLLPKKRK